MTAAKHTPGPWQVARGTWGGEPCRHVTNAAGCPLTSLQHCAEDEANARRIAACVNACEGVPIEVLEARKAGGLPWSVADQIDERVLRDELLEVARLLALATDEGDDAAQGTHYVDKAGRVRCKGSFLETIEKARAAIAKATGSAQ